MLRKFITPDTLVWTFQWANNLWTLLLLVLFHKAEFTLDPTLITLHCTLLYQVISLFIYVKKVSLITTTRANFQILLAHTTNDRISAIKTTLLSINCCEMAHFALGVRIIRFKSINRLWLDSRNDGLNFFGSYRLKSILFHIQY